MVEEIQCGDKSIAPYTIREIVDFYRLPESLGKGERIAIISVDGGYHEDQLATFFEGTGIVPQIVPKSIDGTTNQPAPNAFETSLDIAIAASVAPEATIDVYLAPPGGTLDAFLKALTAVVNDNPSVLCITKVYEEGILLQDGVPLPVVGRIEALFEEARKKEITVCAATGDSALGARYPASSPNVLACGGTRLDLHHVPVLEDVWPDTTFGPSVLFPLPSWQQKVLGVAPSGRNVPDISAHACPGYTGHFGNGPPAPPTLSGTSAAAPLWAGLIARHNSLRGRRLGFLNEKLFDRARREARTFNSRIGLGNPRSLDLRL